ncbi:MAG: GDP-mannose 4,6-dehydratase [Candidatus ainarchaeum sp.]|nr:GDP-mannose 4,6-dehydratase [Candidatus ainarchaeum sp.]
MNELSESYWAGRDVMITGISGFLGSHLAEKLISMGAKVHGLLRRHAVPHYPNIAHLQGKVNLIEGDLMDVPSILNALEKSGATVVFHLAAQSFVPLSFQAPYATYEPNILGTANVLEAIRRGKTVERMQFAGSSEEYGLVHPEETPIRETNPLRPLSPYAASKVAGDYICYTHYKCYGINVVRTRAFNHTGPRRGLHFVTSVISRQVARGIRFGQTDVTIGNPNPQRDFSDVRDILRGYMLAIEKGKPGESYNLGSGHAISIRDLAQKCIEIGGMNGKMSIKIDEARYRPAEVMLLRCDYSKAKADLGWSPQIPLEKTLKDLIDYYVSRDDLIGIEVH